MNKFTVLCLDCLRPLNKDAKYHGTLRCNSCRAKRDIPKTRLSFIGNKYSCCPQRKETIEKRRQSLLGQIRRKLFYCMDCGKILSPGAGRKNYKRCRPCNDKFRTKPKIPCINCGKILSKSARTLGIIKCRHCWGLGRSLSKETKIKIGLGNLGKKCNSVTKEKLRIANTGKKRSAEMREKISGSNSSNWQGGISKIRNIIEGKSEYQDWRIAIFERDNYTCKICQKHGVELNAHHILSFAHHPERRLSIDNGVTLCLECHKEIHWGKKSGATIVSENHTEINLC